MADQERTFQELQDFISKNFEEKHKTTAPIVYEGKPAPDIEHPENMELFKQIAKAEKLSQPKIKSYKSMTSLKSYILHELDRLFSDYPNRITPEISEIKRKMDKLRQILIDEIDSSLYEVRNEIFIDDSNNTFHCSTQNWLDDQYSQYLYPL